MSNVKSITTVRLYGGGHNGNWAARLRTLDGAELYAGLDGKLTMHQAQAVARANPDNRRMRDPITGVATAPYQPLPAGIEVKP